MKLRVFAILAVGLLLGADSKEAQVKKEKDQLIGTWRVLGYEVMGKKDPALAQKMKVLFTFKDFVVQVDEQSTEAGFALDPTKKPKQIDLTPASGPNQGKLCPGIYELNGDMLKIIWNDKGKGRPTDFVTGDGSGNQLVILRKVK